MNGSRVTTPRHYFVGATVLIAVGLVLGLGISAGFGLPRVTRAADAQVASLPASSAALPESPFVGLVSKALPAVVFIDVTKKVGNAVVRNRTRRRLKEAARLELMERPLTGVDLVIIGRDSTRSRDFQTWRNASARANHPSYDWLDYKYRCVS